MKAKLPSVSQAARREEGFPPLLLCSQRRAAPLCCGSSELPCLVPGSRGCSACPAQGNGCGAHKDFTSAPRGVGFVLLAAKNFGFSPRSSKQAVLNAHVC